MFSSDVESFLHTGQGNPSPLLIAIGDVPPKTLLENRSEEAAGIISESLGTFGSGEELKTVRRRVENEPFGYGLSKECRRPFRVR
jgi:hypothetical protein